MSRLVVVSNRVTPVEEGKSSAGGLVVGIGEALLRKGGVWFGWSGEIADSTSSTPTLTRSGSVTYATITLSRHDHEEYYLGFANRTLWPLLHFRLGLIEFERKEFDGYMRVNRLFATALQPLLQPDDLVWIHDYHLIPLGVELRALGVRNRIGFFLHTPLPSRDVVHVLPLHERLLGSLAAYDVVGFQTANDVDAFVDYAARTAGGRIGPNGRLTLGHQALRAQAFPIGIDVEGFARLATKAENSAPMRRLRESIAGRHLLIGVDRMDYSKGLPLRFKAYERLLAQRPDWRGRVTFLQIAPRTRSEVMQYRKLRRELEAESGYINSRFAEYDWTPVRYLVRSFARPTLAGFYRTARIGLVTPLRDGMNLVAKEYVASQRAVDPGVLVLSQFAGAAQELDTALLVNPFDVDAVAEAINEALLMPIEERRERWQAMIRALRRNTSLTWFDCFVSALAAERARPPRGKSAVSSLGADDGRSVA